MGLRPRRTSRVGFALAAGGVVAVAVVSAPRRADAAPPSADLLSKLAAVSSQIEAMQARTSYLVEGKLESLDGDGKTDETKEMQARVESNGNKPHLIVVRYLVDGKDETLEAQRKENERAEAEKKKTDDERQHERKLAIPFLATEQPKYLFDQVETDAHDPDHVRVRITFVPREPTKNTVEGSIWVDATSGRPYGTGFKLSKPGTFIDYVHIQIELGATTPFGPLVSRVTVDGAGGFLFLHKHFRGVANLHDYRVAP